MCNKNHPSNSFVPITFIPSKSNGKSGEPRVECQINIWTIKTKRKIRTFFVASACGTITHFMAYIVQRAFAGPEPIFASMNWRKQDSSMRKSWVVLFTLGEKEIIIFFVPVSFRFNFIFFHFWSRTTFLNAKLCECGSISAQYQEWNEIILFRSMHFAKRWKPATPLSHNRFFDYLLCWADNTAEMCASNTNVSHGKLGKNKGDQFMSVSICSKFDFE